MKVTGDMYSELFNAITEANCKIEEAVNILKDAQLKAEEIYIENGEESRR